MNPLEQKIKHWVDVTDPYNYKLESDKIQITKEIMKIVINTAREAYKDGGNGEYYDEGLGGMNNEFSEERWNEFLQEKGIL